MVFYAQCSFADHMKTKMRPGFRSEMQRVRGELEVNSNHLKYAPLTDARRKEVEAAIAKAKAQLEKLKAELEEKLGSKRVEGLLQQTLG